MAKFLPCFDNASAMQTNPLNEATDISTLIHAFCCQYGHEFIAVALEEYDWVCKDLPDINDPKIEDDERDRIIEDYKKQVEIEFTGFIACFGPEQAFDNIILALGDEPLGKDGIESREAIVRELLRQKGFYVSSVPHQRDRGPYDLLAECDNELAAIDAYLVYHIDAEGDKFVRKASEYRGLVIEIFTLFDALITLTIVFLQRNFDPDDEYLRETFKEIIEAGSIGTGKMLRSFSKLAQLFSEGMTSTQTEKYKSAIEQVIFELENGSKTEVRNLKKAYDAIDEQKREYQEKLDTVKQQYAVCVGDLARNNLKMAIHEEASWQRKISGCDNMVSKKVQELASIQTKISELEDSNQLRIQELHYKITEHKQERQRIAFDLQRECYRVLGRQSPFYGLNIERLLNFNREFRNDAAHTLKEYVTISDVFLYRNFLEEMRIIAFDLMDKCYVPLTVRAIAKVNDIHGQQATLFRSGTFSFPYQVWLPQKSYWVYFNGREEYTIDQEYFMVATPGKPLFRPLIEECNVVHQDVEARLAKRRQKSRARSEEDEA